MSSLKEKFKNILPSTRRNTNARFQQIEEDIRQTNDNAEFQFKKIREESKWASTELSSIKSVLNQQKHNALQISISQFPKRIIEHLDYHIVDHCNLNCASCSTYSPIADKEYVPIETFKTDLIQLRSLIGDKLIRLHILGGEPLLHPDIEAFVATARSIFPATQIDVTSNGLLVKQMPDSFWEALKNNNVDLKLTKYPIQLDYKELIEYATARNVFAYSASDEVIGSFRRIPLNPKGTSSIYSSFLQCPYNNCPQLKNGKLYLCPACGMADILNKCLVAENHKANFSTMSSDYINIHDVESDEVIFNYLSNPIPFCRYCDMNNASTIPWSNSTKKAAEWVDFD